MKTASATALAAVLAAAAMLCAGCSGGGGTASAAEHSKSTCPSSWRGGWQQLSNRVHAPVYCPGWIPSPLTGNIHGQWSTGVDVSPDRSYLVGFIWVEHQDEVHVNM